MSQLEKFSDQLTEVEHHVQVIDENMKGLLIEIQKINLLINRVVYSVIAAGIVNFGPLGNAVEHIGWNEILREGELSPPAMIESITGNDNYSLPR